MRRNGFAPIIIILAIVALAGLIGGAFYLGRQTNQPANFFQITTPAGQTASVLTQAPATSLAPIIKTGETANWRMYVNDKYHFRMNYPSDWSVGNEEIYENIWIRRLETKEGEFPRVEMSMMVESGKISDLWLNKFREAGINTEASELRAIGGINGKIYETEGVGDGTAGWRTDFVAEKNNQIYRIYLVSDLKYKNVYKNLFNQILSTFRFTD